MEDSRVFGGRIVTLGAVMGIRKSRSQQINVTVQDDRGSVRVLPSISDRVKYYQAVLNKWSTVKAPSG